MKFSIITICYNEAKRIEGTLNSICCQTYSDYEHIIEDGGSTDGTLEVISRFASLYSERQIRLYSEKDEGLYDAMNRAITRAKGEYLCFINSGDYLFDKNTLANVAKQIEELPGMDWYYGSCIVVFPNGDEYLQIPTTIENIEGNDLSEELKKGQLRLNHQSIFAHRRCFENNYFDISYRLRAELKWYYECLFQQIKIKRLDFPVCRYAWGGLSERAVSVATHARETRRIFEELNLLTEENREKLPREDNYSECCKNIYNQWLALRQTGLCVADYLKRKNISRIAIYGYAEFGAHLINELRGSDIQIICLIDQADRYPFAEINVVKPDEFQGNVDLVIVTAILHYSEIEDFLSERVDCSIVSLEDMLEDMWN